MKADRYRELYSKIDTDSFCDNKIKNELLLCEAGGKYIRKSIKSKGYRIGNEEPFFHIFRKISFIGQIIPSLAFLAFLLVAVMGYRIHLLSVPPTNNTLPQGAPYVTESPAPADTLSDVPGVNATEITQAAVTIAPSVVVSEDMVNNAAQDLAQVSPEAITGVPADKDTFNIAEDFYIAYFDVLTAENVKYSIPNLVVRFHGTVDSVNPNDFTDIVLTRDGVPVDNSITLTNKIDQFVWSYEDITDFYFEFANANIEPGVYGLTGKYNGVPFTVYNKIIEPAVTDEAAHPEDLSQVGWAGSIDKEGNYNRISELAFNFIGQQNAFYQSDLTDLKLTRNNEEIPCSFEQDVFRYYEVYDNSNTETAFHLILNSELTEPGTYVITGKYQGVQFSSMKITIP
jgi:hypothetical protein